MTSAEASERIRVNLLRIMERERAVGLADMARSVGCQPKTLADFLRRDYVSKSLARRVVAAYPEAGEGLGVCPHCGCLAALY